MAAALPMAGAPAKADQSGFSFGPGDTIGSEEPGSEKYSTFRLTAKQGRINNIGNGEVVLGSDIAKELGKTVGDTLYLPVAPKVSRAGFVNHKFTVIGVMNKTLTAPDSFAMMSLHDAQRALGDSLPPAVRSQVDPSKLVSGIDVYGKPGVNLDDLAKKINAQVPGVKAQSPTELVNAFKQFSLIFSAITLGAALLALIVGGLSVVNTMLMSVTERYREIGLKEAVGAKTRHIIREFLSESVVIGLIGGSIGLSLGWVITTPINASTASHNPQPVLLSPTLAIGALLFSVVLGGLAGVIPAFSAARLDPVTALRSQ